MSRMRYCSFFECNSFASKEEPRSMFAFPQPGLPGSQEERRTQEWIQRSCNPSIVAFSVQAVATNKKLVCGAHFEDNQYIDERKCKLRPGEIPKWNVVHGTAEDRCHQGAEPNEVLGMIMVL